MEVIPEKGREANDLSIRAIDIVWMKKDVLYMEKRLIEKGAMYPGQA